LDLHTYEILYRIEESHWWHSARRDMVLDWIRQAYPGRRDLTILDAGCGTGLMLQEMRQLGSPEGVDISEEALDFCRQRGLTQVHKADVRKLPFDNDTFDVVTALDVLEHVDDDTGVLDEFARVLKPGGRAFVFVPAHRWLWSLQDEISHHRRRYTAGTLREVVGASRLSVERLSYVSMFLLPAIFLGRQWLRVTLPFWPRDTENDLHPAWSNAILRRIFEAEIPLLRRRNLPFGASILLVARKEA
jgi:SAM-dependent methyltransferase